MVFRQQRNNSGIKYAEQIILPIVCAMNGICRSENGWKCRDLLRRCDAMLDGSADGIQADG